MPRYSERRHAIQFFAEVIQSRQRLAQFCLLLGINNSDKDILDVMLLLFYVTLKATRYIQPRLCWTVHQLEPFGNHEDLTAVFTELRDYHSWLNEREF
jgi:hypothetical protein